MSPQEKNQIKNVLQNPSWPVVEQVSRELIKDLEGSYVVRDNEWETLKGAIYREAKIQGIKDFIAKLYAEAQ